MSAAITVLVVRGPDSGDDVRIWDGDEEVTTKIRTIVVDAGAGWEMSDWMQYATDEEASCPFAVPSAAIRQAFRDPPGYEYIKGWLSGEYVQRQWVDTDTLDVDGMPRVLTFDEVEWLGLDGTGRTA